MGRRKGAGSGENLWEKKRRLRSKKKEYELKRGLKRRKGMEQEQKRESRRK